MLAARRSKLLIASAACFGAFTFPGAAFTQAALPPPAQPPELQALEQHMSELTVSSQRLTGKESIGGKLPRKLAPLKGLSTEFSGEESIAPAFANVTLKLAGRSVTLLQLGSTLYTHDPSIARIDGGRPWVMESLTGKRGQFGSKPSLGTSGVGGGGTLLNPTPFKSDAELIKEGTNVHALGASTVDGQATVGFAGVVTARRLAESALSKKQVARLHREHVKLKASFEVFIAANGVPVRMKVVLAIGKVRVNVSADVLAIDFPVTVPAPPPAAETIGAAELEKIEAARLKKLLKKLKKHHK
ncbi:MAG TPA: hypothetical protein VLJ80_10520 [Solirubrobacteraceae bacterium]|nr:hypothetical protein [Solirubrobacteraceae bacterium]